MDTRLATLERRVAAGDFSAKTQLVSLKMRKGEKYPVGAIVTLKQTGYKRLDGRWEIVDSYDGRYGRKDCFQIRKVGKSGKMLSGDTNLEIIGQTRLESFLESVEAPQSLTNREKQHEAAKEGALVVREFSRYGPCITIGPIVRETKSFFVVEVVNHHGPNKNKRLKKSNYHNTPCKSCRDHHQTQYPDGYVD